MALYATNRFAGDGTTTKYEINFVGQYIDRSHVKAYRVANATKVRTPVVIAPEQWLNATTITGFAPTPVGQTLVIYRDTPKPPMVDFVNGSRLTEYNLDLVARQGLFVAMEALDSNDHEAIDELLAAIKVVVGLVNQATAAVTDATAAALAAAGSAADALGYRNAAQAAQTAAETARNAAQASAGNAATSATNARNSATAAASSAAAAATSESNAAASASTATTQAGIATTQAGNAATSASTASTQATNAANSATAASGSASAASTSAGDASTSATNAATSATNASYSAAAAAESATTLSIQGRMCCRVVVVTASPPVLRLERCGGQTMSINGVSRVIPAAGITINMTASATPAYVYAGWNGTDIVLSEATTAPVWDSTLGQWVYPGDTSRTPVAFASGDNLANPARSLRNYYNAGPATFTQSLSADYVGTWNAIDTQLAAMSILLMPGDTIDITGQASIMCVPVGRVGDLTVKLGGGVLCRARNTHSGETYLWQNYTARCVIQRGSGEADPAQQAIFELWYYPISNTGNTWAALGSGGSGVIVRIDPYRWA